MFNDIHRDQLGRIKHDMKDWVHTGDFVRYAPLDDVIQDFLIDPKWHPDWQKILINRMSPKDLPLMINFPWDNGEYGAPRNSGPTPKQLYLKKLKGEAT